FGDVREEERDAVAAADAGACETVRDAARPVVEIGVREAAPFERERDFAREEAAAAGDVLCDVHGERVLLGSDRRRAEARLLEGLDRLSHRGDDAAARGD